MTTLGRSSRSSLVGPVLLVLAVALVVGVPTIVLGEIAADDTRQRVRDAELQVQRRTAERVVRAIHQHFADVRYYLGYAARPSRGTITPLARAVEDGDPAAVQAELVALYRVFPAAVRILSAYDTTGVPISIVGLGPDSGGSQAGGGSFATRAEAGPIRPQSAALSSLPARLTTATRDALAESRGAIALEPLDPTRPMSDKRMPIGIALTGSGGAPAGFLFGVVELSVLGAALVEASGGTGEIYVLDAGGRLLRRLSKAATDAEIGRDLSSSGLVAALIGGQRVDGEAADPIAEGPHLVSARRTEPLTVGTAGTVELDLGWHVIAARPLALVFVDVDAALAQFRVVRLTLLGVLLAGAFLLGASLGQIRRQRRQLEVAGRHKSEFLANMSHELRTPLNAVIGFSDILLQRIAGPVNEKQAEYLRDISSSGRHLLALINDLLDLSKIEAGRMELRLGAFSLPATLGDGITMVRERAGTRRIALELDVDPAVDNITGDERKIKQVVANLLSNAVKFTPDGGSVAVRAERQGDEIRVAVKDTGVGIAREDQARIFEEFEQAKHGREAAEGTGLGLALSKKFVELHGGRIWVESEVGRGSTFTFALPLLHARKDG